MIKQLQLLVLVMCNCLYLQAQVVQGSSNSINVEVAPAASLLSSSTPPILIWIQPHQSSSSLQSNKLILKVGVNSAVKVKSISVFVNGLESVETRGLGTTSTDASKFTAFIDKELELSEGVNEVKVQVENDNSQKTTEVRTVNVAMTLANSLAQRKDYALLFATNEYLEHDPLKNPVFDATTLAKELTDYYGFQVELIINPAKSTILKKLREYSLRNYLPDDQLFIFFAGHGKFDEVHKDGYLVAKDSKRDDEIYDSYISYSTLRTQIDNNPCKHIFLTIDACFGGTFDQVLAKRGSFVEDDGYGMVAQADFIKRKLQYKTRIFLTSGGKNYVSDGREGRHSPFASKFIEVLRGYGGKLKVITTQQLLVNIETGKEIPRYGGFGDNEPGSEFVFVAK